MSKAIDLLVTGGTGYVGRHLIPALLARGHRVRALARETSLARVPAGAQAVVGDALDADSVAAALRPDDTVVHLVGTPHPSPAKAKQFEEIDLASIRATVNAARRVGIGHLVYVSVAQPALVMRAYLWVRGLGETMIKEAGLTATVLRPWYVLGPGHRWPIVLLPFYKIAECFPSTRESGERLGFVTIDQMASALVHAVENPPDGGKIRIIDVPAIRRAGK
ncbi:MAG: NAD(P)H-binding protein [Dehalococcoidia bacterium]|nr:NAD(P)H-binding protein [Dehalococcoidia bacterium]MDZ4346609.1 NAD(P)H-binding protein [Candidatus Binatia bacterium]